MLDDSLFASDGLIERPVMLGGKKTKLHFRELPATEFNACFLAGEGDRRVLSPAHLIAAALRNPDGSPAITAERAAQLKAGPFNAIFSAALDVNGEGAKETPGNASPSAESDGSGTS